MKNRWHIYFDVDMNHRTSVKTFNADTRKEALETFKRFKEENSLSHELKLENCNIKWWRIYHKSKGNAKRRYSGKCDTVFLFTAQTRKGAYKRYMEECERRKWNPKEYFYTSAWSLCTKNKDGGFNETHIGMGLLSEDCEELTMGSSEYSAGLERTRKEQRKEISDKVAYFIRTGHSPNEWFDLGFHILDDLLYNIPILLKRRNSYPTEYTEMAKRKISGNPSKYSAYSNKIDDLASELWGEDLEEFLLYLRLYKYFSDSGIIDENDIEMVKIDKKYKHMLPIYEGTESDLDYKKLYKMTNSLWKRISTWLGKNLLNCWD